MLIKLEDGRLKDVALTEVTADNYIVPEGEECSWHCMIEIVQFSSQTGKRLSVPRIQKFEDKIWRSIMQRHLKIQGYTVTILHDPTADIKAKEQKLQMLKEQAKPQRKSAQEQSEEFQKAVSKAVAEEIAKLSKISKGKKANVNSGNSKGE